MHVAANNGHGTVGRELMTLDPEVAYKVNNKMLTPLYTAIVNEKNNMVKTMLEVDRTLACTQFSDVMFPVHVAAHVGSRYLLDCFFREYPDYAELLDPRERNIFHIAAEQGHNFIFRFVFQIMSVGARARMCNASDCEGNTPLDIAIMKENWSIEGLIFCLEETIRNNQDLTPGELSRRFQQLIRKCGISDDSEDEKMWEKIQVTGLDSVLITTVAFAVSFTVLGGYNQDNGTPVLGRRYMFWAYILANAFAFIQGFISLFALLLNAVANMPPNVIDFAVIFFLLAASSMIVAFGLKLYVTLAPICLPIVILLLIITLFLASPVLFLVLMSRGFIPIVVHMLERRRTTVAGYMVSLVLIFSLALLSLLYSVSL